MEHYYGDTVRRLFIAGAIIMIGTLPFFTKEIGEPIILSIIGILITSVAAGLTAPQFVWSATINIFVSASAVTIFEWYAASWYSTNGRDGIFFWVNQLLAINFLIAFYYSIKTLRGMRAQKTRG